MFDIITVPDQAASLPEQLGTKRKFWYRDENSVRCLFKEGRPLSGDDWSEKVASELCDRLGLPHVRYELATWREQRGVVCQTFVPDGGTLVHGNELLAKIVAEYPTTKFFKVSQHMLDNVLVILGIEEPQVQVPLGWNAIDGVEKAVDVFIGYLLLDAWIANQDRHHENWGLVVTPQATIHLAPSYDHASSLGSNETDETRHIRLTTRDRRRHIKRYVEKANSAFYASDSATTPLSTLDAVRTASKLSPKSAQAWIERLRLVSAQEVAWIFEQIPRNYITPTASEFAQHMLVLNRQRLLALEGVLT